MNDDSLQICNADDLSSEFGYDSEQERIRATHSDLIAPEKPQKTKLGLKKEVTEEYSREECRRERVHILTLDAYSRHKKYINDYILFFGGSADQFKRDTSRDKTDHDVIRENHQFLWDNEGDDSNLDSWEKRLAKKYYDKLFKEYCIADLSLYKQNKIAMRWRIEKEVVSGKGQFACGEKRCNENEELRSWEVNFGYVEHGQKKNALVKLRLCPKCSRKLNYHHQKREVKKEKKRRIEESNETDNKKRKSSNSAESCSDSDIDSSREDSSAKVTGGSAKVTDDSAKVTSDPANKDDDPDQVIWSKSVPVTEEKSREDEFNEYFEDMFL